MVRPASEPGFSLRPLGLAPAQGFIYGEKTLLERPFRLDVPSVLAEAGDRLWPPFGWRNCKCPQLTMAGGAGRETAEITGYCYSQKTLRTRIVLGGVYLPQL